MRKLVFVFLLVPTAAYGQAAFEPYTVSEQQHQAIVNYLGDIPAKYANPLLSTLAQMEQAAQQKKTEELKKPKDTPK